ncbi:hypothetical protein INT47_000280 [Mucor saturninus]|uniref:Sodium/calcium exchanger membrane region domain-containing protein n=1 Tax=Mucor saturninus TaxID=64648 RepID=A0A8H7UZW0_9FUNG|nr:hypothetical protein INT47_000280 [Mucor saturninus]
MSPNSSRPSFHFDAISRSTSVNGSISSKTYRRPMTPRIGIRTSVFGAIEFQEQVNSIRRANSSLSMLPNNSRYRQNSMPPPMWQNTQGQHLHNQQPFHQPSSYDNSIGVGRQRASTMTDQLLTLSQPSSSIIISPAALSDTQDYFTYLSAQNQTHSINIQTSSPPPPLLAPEIRIPEIRLAPPNNDIIIPSPEYMDHQGTYFWYSPTSPAIGRSRGRSTSAHSLAPPSILSEADDSSFFSARQSFEISPSNSFDHQNQLMSAIMGIPKLQDNVTVSNDAKLNIPINEGVISSLLYPNISSRHYRENSDYSYNSKHYIGASSPYTSVYIIDSIAQVLLPTLQGWSQKSIFSKISALAAAPIVMIFTLTLPVAEVDQVKVDDIEVIEDCSDIDTTVVRNNVTIEQQNYLSVPTGVSDSELLLAEGKVLIDDFDTKQGWNKHLLMIQSVIGSAFIFGVLTANDVIPMTIVVIGVLLGIALAIFVLKTTKTDEPPTWYWTMSFVGFFVALNWIFLLANEVVGLLQALGEIFSISDAIMGLTVFALGNSVGDFVANTAIAKMGFPTMAISACYAGPLLNMVLGVGVSSLYQFWKTGNAYQLDIAPTIIVSSVGLLSVLLSTLLVVNMNGYCVTKNLGIWMIGVYLTCCTINFLLEFKIIF